MTLATILRESSRLCCKCGRTLNISGYPDTLNCGGDCWGCLRPLEDDLGA